MKSVYAKIILCVIICTSLGFLSGISTADSITNWFQFVKKPSWNPPNWLFAPVWTLLYILMGISVALIWHSNSKNKKSAISLFVIQFILNLCWSIIFFNQHQTGWAFVEIIIMLIFIIMTNFSFYKINKTAAYLLLPYICWVSFATVLNGTIWFLNK
jgi:tryptophan-rich sensory protein